ncbi:MAG: hypothetical protein NTU58_02360 [Candidatus Nealsonbacteria bacterium]|nr:hypothetical protein [Candidatus Nealsonbacteria bacterium]
MAKKIKNSLPWLTMLAICFLVLCGAGLVLKEIMADTAQPSVTVGNSAPTIGTVILNTSTAITINENTYVTVSGTTTFTDNNGYADVTSATSTLFLNNTTTCGSGSTNPNWCYYISSCATSSCAGLSCTLTCSANVWFVAEPSTASSSYSTKAWQMDITIQDSGGNATTGSSSQELNVASYMSVGTSTEYGTVNPGATSSNITTDATNTGNYHINAELSGVNMQTGGATASIAVGQQKYSTGTIGDWSADGTALTIGATIFDLVLPKPTVTTSNSTDIIYWVINISTSTLPGVYNGTNTFNPIYAAS